MIVTYKIQLCTKKTYKVTVVLKKNLIVLVVMVVVVVDMTSGSSKKLLVSNYRQTSTYGHLSIMATYLCPGRQSIQCFLFKPLDNGHLSKMAMAQQPLFQQPIESQEWSWNFIPMALWWLITAIIFWLCSIYTAAVSIYCLKSILINKY